MIINRRGWVPLPIAQLFLTVMVATASIPASAQIPPPVELYGTFDEQHQARVTALTFHPTYNHLLISGGGKNDGQFMLWNWQTGDLYERDRAQGTGIEGLALSSDGQWLVTTGADRQVHFWTLPDGEFAHTLDADFYNLLDVEITPDNRILVSGGLEGIRVWDLQSQRSLYTLVRFLPVTQLAIHPDGEQLVSSTTQGSIQVWNLNTGERQRTWPAHSTKVDVLAFAPDGSTLLSAGSDTIHLWDTATGIQLQTLQIQEGKVGAIAFHPFEPLLIVAVQNQIEVWDWQTGDRLGHWPLHQHWLSSLAFSSDGQWLASGADNGEIRLWQWQTTVSPPIETDG